MQDIADDQSQSNAAGPPPYDELNREFYSADPASYFRQRLNLLALHGAQLPEMEDVFARGFEWGRIRVGGAELSPRASELDDGDAVTGFLIVETQVLLHHAAEAFVRLFIAHVEGPECPWLAMSAFLDFRKFRDTVAELAASIWDAKWRDGVRYTFAPFSSTDPERTAYLDEGVEQCERLIRKVAGILDSDKNLYNSAKHGLTILAGQRAFQVTADGGQPIVGVSGHALSYLERQKPIGEPATWLQTTKWPNPQREAWLCELVISQIELLWAVARWRYTNTTPAGFAFVTKEALDIATFGFPASSVNSFRRPIVQETTSK